MREVRADQITDLLKVMLLDANYYIGEDILDALKAAASSEPSPTGRAVLELIVENHRVAAEERLAMCQDTGMVVVYAELGQDVHISGGGLEEAINRAVEEAYYEGYLRKSVVQDPLFERANTGTNGPAVIYVDIVKGDTVKLVAAPKGFGSENMSALRMMKPADGVDGVKRFVVDTVKVAGPNPCPPTIVGVGIGGTADKAMFLARRATWRKLGQHNHDERYAELEEEMLAELNDLGIGPMGLGGRTTALAVNIEHFPTHIAGLPVAVNVCCHASRHVEGVI